MDTQMLIGSKFEKGTETEEPILNPKTGATILNLPEASPAQIEAAVAAAEKAFATWSRTTPAQRSGYLLKIADRIEAEAKEFAALEALNCGKPINAALNDEIPAIVDCYRFFAGAVRSMPGQVAGEYLPGHTSMVRRDPIGVVASIAPWNYPLMMMAWKLAPAIAGGNTVVFKPSEQTPLTALKLARILAEILPEGVVNVVLGRGDSVGNALINHPKVNMISITGDVAGQVMGILTWLFAKLGLSWLLDAWLSLPIVGGNSLSVSFTGTFIVFVYVWLPFMILPVQAALERVPGNLVEASSDLGASPGQTFRNVLFPLALPGIVAGSIFTFSLTLGDYIIPAIIGTSRLFIGQAVYSQQGTAGNIPLAAAFTVVPIVIMGFYLWGAKRMGAFDAL